MPSTQHHAQFWSPLHQNTFDGGSVRIQWGSLQLCPDTLAGFGGRDEGKERIGREGGERGT